MKKGLVFFPYLSRWKTCCLLPTPPRPWCHQCQRHARSYPPPRRRRVSSLFLSAADHRADLSPPHRWPFFPPTQSTGDATTDATAAEHFQNAFSRAPRRSFRAQSSQYARVLPPCELFVDGHPSV